MQHERPLGAADLCEGAGVVALDRAWLEVEEAVGKRCRPAPARCEARPDPVVEGDCARPVAELVGRRGDRQHRVEGNVEPCAPSHRRRGQPAAVDEEVHLSLALDAELIRHRVPDALGGAPVDLPDIVVVVVLAHRLELGAQPERPATEPGAPITASLRSAREAPRARQVREHPDLGVLAHATDPASDAKRAVNAGCGCRERVFTAPNRHDLRRERPHRLPRLDAQLGRLGLAHRRPEIAERLEHERSTDAARRPSRERCARRSVGVARRGSRPRSRRESPAPRAARAATARSAR